MEPEAAGPSHPDPNIPKPSPIPKKRRIRNAGVSVLEGMYHRCRSVTNGTQAGNSSPLSSADFAKNHPDSEPNHEQRRILLQNIHVRHCPYIP